MKEKANLFHADTWNNNFSFEKPTVECLTITEHWILFANTIILMKMLLEMLFELSKHHSLTMFVLAGPGLKNSICLHINIWNV